MKRSPVVANYFYPGDAQALLATLSELLEFSSEKIEAFGIIVPHAGYIYSGKVAGKVYGRIEPPDIAIILGPNHTGFGENISLYSGESYLTPLGEAKINKEISEFLIKEGAAVADTRAHLREHSLEVQVPFLQYLNPQIEIVPLVLMDLSLDEINFLGETLAIAISEITAREDKNILIVASTDFSHYESHAVAHYKDSLAINEILSFSEEGLMRVVYEKRISMCGVIPVAVTLNACKRLGATKAELVDYKTSGDITGDYSAVVGYAGIILF